MFLPFEVGVSVPPSRLAYEQRSSRASCWSFIAKLFTESFLKSGLSAQSHTIAFRVPRVGMLKSSLVVSVILAEILCKTFPFSLKGLLFRVNCISCWSSFLSLCHTLCLQCGRVFSTKRCSLTCCRNITSCSLSKTCSIL